MISRICSYFHSDSQFDSDVSASTGDVSMGIAVFSIG